MNAKLCIYIMILIFLSLQYSFWVSRKGSIIELRNICKKTNTLIQSIIEVDNRYKHLVSEIHVLKTDVLAIEESARYKLGLIKPGEEYYQIVEPIE